MSLQVWLPLTDGTLKQQGLSDATVSSAGTINLTNSGKLGKCLTFTSTAGGLTIPPSTMTSFTNACSVAFWFKINDWGTSYATYFQAGTGSTPWTNYIFGFLRYSTNSKICFTISDGSTNSAGNYQTSTMSTGVWYHVSITYETGKCRIYLNGELDHEYVTTIVPAFNKITKITVGRNNNESSYQTQCDMNDLRIYDHCLSPMEVKQLSQGLVLHYPLNNSGWGQENIAINTGTRSPDRTSQVEWKGFKIGNLPITEGEQLTVSFDLEMKIGTAITNARPYLLVYNTNYRGEHGQWIYASNSSTYDMIPSGTYAVGDIIKRRVSFTINAASTFNPGTSSEDWIEFYSNYSTENEITIKNIKIERGDKATPWCPNASDDLAATVGLNSTTEYDCSGFGNNGVLNGINEYTSDTIRYNVSRIFNGVNNPVTLPNLSTLISDGIFTFSVWFKKETNQWSSKSWETIFGGPSGFEFSSKSGSTNSPVLYAYSWNKGTYNYTLDEWHHFVMVRTTSGTVFYLDGVQAFTGTAGSIPSGNYFLGAWSTITGQNYKGKMNDARIYATALSADDIKSLYENKGYIDNKGNVYGTLYEIG